MRIAFYAPMKPWDHPVPSGDRRMARLLIQALEANGHTLSFPSRLRSYDRFGDEARQQRLRRLGLRIADRVVRRLQALRSDRRPEAWLSYHVYHKSPDYLGPVVSRVLEIPYLIAEASVARKQAEGEFALGFAESGRAIEVADVVLAMTGVDRAALTSVVPPGRLVSLPPFTDVTPFRQAAIDRDRHRSTLARTYGLDPELPWLLAIGMMRDDAKLVSYRRLAAALTRVARRFRLVVVGDGPARAEVEAALAQLDQPVTWTGRLDVHQVASVSAAADLFVWPAVREAYGLAMLEAGAAGLPVVAGRTGGVADVVAHGQTGLLVDPDDPDAFATAVRQLLDDPQQRRSMGAAAARFVARERSLGRAGKILKGALEKAIAAPRAWRH